MSKESEFLEELSELLKKHDVGFSLKTYEFEAELLFYFMNSDEEHSIYSTIEEDYYGCVAMKKKSEEYK